ncbi:hypothetical protein AJ80_02160 [Polytolypa hystricis UAMH7299]|uniref:ATPase synthesis protein 25 n=1 Tax=Polytolypa hystricis (strain UAMH7299) TaxID=1447883 RepID=A0A2B7YS91_POLH7|nr:hypothetical protein AJ80_02160 [Polytolypa hystricis UAMH7299]
MSRAVLRGIRCHACRYDVIQSFVAVAGLSIHSSASALPQRSNFLPPQSPLSVSHARPFTCSTSRRSSNTANQNPESNEVKGKEEALDQNAEHIPWYLRYQQQQVETAASHPLGERQAIPALPDNAPPILDELLQHISVEIGLDNLALLDLRGVDPHPALGANLIMIVGTARSIKHVNVSADRLCRWLRSQHKMRPVADGLMGRNELKIKLRRKARRAKLASSVGSTLEQADDGLTTGWICVNVGTVKGGESPQSELVKPPSFEGFGTFESGTKIVVQMMVEDKRSELDLEGLWGAVLARKARKDAWAANKSPSSAKAETGPVYTSTVIPRFPGIGLRSSSKIFGLNGEQRRGICNTTRLLTNVSADTTAQETTRPPFRQARPYSKYPNSSTATRYVPPNAAAEWPQSSQVKSLLQMLGELSPEEARHELGAGPDDRSSTIFLRLFHEALASAPVEARPGLRLGLMCIAVTSGHPEYPKQRVFEAFQQFAMSEFHISKAQGRQVLAALLCFPHSDAEITPETARLPTEDIELAMKVLEHLSLRGENIFAEDIFLMLYNGCSYRVPVRYGAADAPGSLYVERSLYVEEADVKEMHERLTRIQKAMKATLTSFSYDSYPDLLRAHFYLNDMPGFWQHWHRMGLNGWLRTKQHYLLVLNLCLERGNENYIIRVLDECVPMIEREEPPVLLDAELAEKIMACLFVVDPQIRDHAQEDVLGPYVQLWNKCLNALFLERASLE